IDLAIGNAGPERFTIAGLAQRRINFTDVTAREADIVRQIVRACFDGDAAAASARAERRLQRRRRCCANDIEPTTGRLRDEARPPHGRVLEEGWARSIRTSKDTLSLGIGRAQASPQHPGYLDVLRMRTDDTPGCGCGFAQAEQKAIVDVGQTQSFSLTAAV